MEPLRSAFLPTMLLLPAALAVLELRRGNAIRRIELGTFGRTMMFDDRGTHVVIRDPEDLRWVSYTLRMTVEDPETARILACKSR
jgi:hypothetical protein